MNKWLICLLALGAAASAHADTYQLSVASFTVNWVQVSTHTWTQVDTPQMVGRKNIEIYNIDTSSAVYCRHDNLPATENTRPDQTQPTGTRPIATSSAWGLSLSNFSSNGGAYPVSASMPVYCISAKFNVLASTVAVTQSY